MNTNSKAFNWALLINTANQLKCFSSSLYLSASPSQKAAVGVLSATIGVFLFSILTSYFQKREAKAQIRNAKNAPEIDISSDFINDDIRTFRSPSVRSTTRRHGSVLSGIASGTSEVGRDYRKSLFADCVSTTLTSQQLGVMGMEALENSINYWEDALAVFVRDKEKDSAAHEGDPSSLSVTALQESQFCQELQKILNSAYDLQADCELLFLDQRSVLFRSNSSTCRGRGSESDYNRSAGLSSPAESFVSAQGDGWSMADLREFDEFSDLEVEVDKLNLYQSALKHFEEDGIPCRILRTELVRCSSDLEYLCKLHCIRIVFQWMFKDSSTWTYFADTGKKVLSDLLICAERDPKEFLLAYEEMLDFLHDTDCWDDIELELTARGVKAMTFYDIVLDYILMDAFEDLESPPSSVIAVVQNRWLSNGFKESALSTAVWSVLKAKRRMLKYQRGFMAHFYSVSEKISPLMAWGFLGPDEKLKDLCQYFKDQVISFLLDIFSFHHCRYTELEEMAEDIIRLIHVRVENVTQKLSASRQSTP